MNLKANIVGAAAVALLTSHSAIAAKDKAVQDFQLDEHSVYKIPVSVERVTTISFPSRISALEGANITTSPEIHGNFILSYKPGNYFFSIRGVEKAAVTNLNVVWNRKTYVLELDESPTPLLSINFHTDVDSKPANPLLSPDRLLGLMDKAKAYPLLKAYYPESVEDVEYSDAKRTMDYDDFEVCLEEAFRFDPEDTLIFRVSLKNKTDHDILYQPQSFAVRAGQHVYYQSLSDASGVMPANGATTAYFAVTGTPLGDRNDLSLKNEFTVMLSRVDKPAGQPEPKADAAAGSGKTEMKTEVTGDK